MEVKSYCEKALPEDAKLYYHFYALIVHNGKEYCNKKIDCRDSLK